MATDLRLIAALLHVMKNIERMGDQCVNIAKLIPIAGHEPPADEQMLNEPRDDGQAVRALIRQAKRAFAGSRRRHGARPGAPGRRGRQPQPRVLPARDRDRRRADRREWAMTMMLVARALERIGDNAVDIGEQVAFLVTGLFREFEDASHPGAPRRRSRRAQRSMSRPGRGPSVASEKIDRRCSAPQSTSARTRRACSLPSRARASSTRSWSSARTRASARRQTRTARSSRRRSTRSARSSRRRCGSPRSSGPR